MNSQDSFLLVRNGAKFDAEMFMDDSSEEGESRKSQAVDMIFIGSESGQLELRYGPFVSF